MKRTKEENRALNQKYKEKQSEWYLANRKRVLRERKKYRKANRDKINKRHREIYYQKYRKQKMMKIYGMTSGEYDALIVIKNCQCCGNESALTFDHDHCTGLIRGVLCNSCNLGIGQIGDTIKSVKNALNYLTNCLHSSDASV